MDTYVSTLISSGADAMLNMFEVIFQPPTSVGDSNADLTVRTDGFTPPTPSQAVYQNHYKTVSVDRPATKINLDRTFDVTIRLDANYDVYKTLLLWQSKSSIAARGYAANSIPTAELGAVTVKALDTPISKVSDIVNGDALAEMKPNNAIWDFRDVWIESITPPTYSTSAAEPAKVVAKFRFGSYTDPQSNFLK